jgi:hypothetical protein
MPVGVHVAGLIVAMLGFLLVLAVVVGVGYFGGRAFERSRNAAERARREKRHEPGPPPASHR